MRKHLHYGTHVPAELNRVLAEPKRRVLTSDQAQAMAEARWSQASATEKQQVGRKLGSASRAKWARMTAEERAAEMSRRRVLGHKRKSGEV